VPYVAKLAGAKKVGVLGYGATENSKVCAQTTGNSVKMYAKDSGVSLGYLSDDVAYGMPNGIGPEVSAMKKAGVDFVSTCIDLNGMKTIAQELHRQGMDKVVLYHPNSYNQQFVKDAGSLFEGDYVTVGFRPFEADTKGTQLGDFKTWIEKQGSQPTELAMVGWINADLAYQGLLAAGPRFDRDKVTAATNAMKDYDAGGLLEPINWGEAHTPYTQETRSQDSGGECGVIVKIESGKFVTVAPPDKPWLCWSQTDLTWSDPKPTAFG
jgi:ABC-type branched-subunit amino acid transport system substrate-binding protein